MISTARLPAQGVCDSGNGPLDAAQPAGITPEQIIQKFAANEGVFKAARERYGYTLNVDIQTLDNYGRPDGEYAEISEILQNDAGKRVERATFAPQSTLRRVALSQDDLDDIRQRLPFPLNPEELPKFSISYTGRQKVDELDTYVFKVVPKNTKKEKNLFDGRIWVDQQDLMIVKTCGKPREDESARSTKKNAIVSATPVFVTYREEIDGKFWFPTYARADEPLYFPTGFVHVRVVVKYTGYKPLARSN
jgi:hypothetical protein